MDIPEAEARAWTDKLGYAIFGGVPLPPRPLPPSPEQNDQKQEVLAPHRPSQTESIAGALVIKDGNIFFLTEPDGCVPLRPNHGFGLYYHDCRYLSGYTMHLGGTDPVLLVSTEADGHATALELTNDVIPLDDGGQLDKELLAIGWTRRLDGDDLTLTDRLLFQNLSQGALSITVTLAFDAQFEDVFTIRQLTESRPGRRHPASWQEGELNFRYDGADGLHRRLSVLFSPAAAQAPALAATEGVEARFDLKLPGRASQAIEIVLAVSESMQDNAPRHARLPPGGPALDTVGHRAADWTEQFTQIETDSVLLNRVLDRSFVDLGVLRSSIGDERFFAAGVPWFATLFGRDSLITGLQTLAFNPELTEETLRLLASRQGDKVDPWRDEQPGKILHELRVGELARLGEIPHAPYYGTIDATSLFLILIGRHAAWTGSLQLFQDLRANIERALHWMTDYGATSSHGYLAYAGSTEHGLANKGWKDSRDAIVNADGSLARPPIAVVEVQGYAYRAWQEIAGLFERAGEADRAAGLRNQAQALQERFERQFWLDAQGCYALALQQDGEPAAVVSSNTGQALWTEIASPDHAARTVDRLMAPDMFSGWGIRTLSTSAARYSPIGYHLGTVWPHDNSLIAAGFRRYGRDREALQLAAGLIDAASLFPVYRLPELFAGFSRSEYEVPVPYPVACHPQAWAAGSLPYLIQTCLGLSPEAFDGRLRIIRPILPPFVNQVTLRGLRVSSARVDLRFRRSGDLAAEVDVIKIDGRLQILVEPPQA